MEDGGVDPVAARARGERARRVAEEGEPGERRAAERGAEIRRVEDPDVRPAEALRRQVGRRYAAVLAAVGGRHEGTVPARAREHDVARLVTDEQRADNAGRQRRDINDADAVREVIHHPDFAVGAGRDGHGLETDRDRSGVGQVARAVDGEYLQSIVGRVDREQVATVRRQRERADLTALELDE